MEIYLVRHGEALDAFDDQQRPLSHHGQQHIEELAKQLLTKGCSPAQIIQSGILRAEQTATIIAKALNIKDLELAADLRPNSNPDKTIIEIESRSQSTLYVSHLPLLDNLCFKLLSGNTTNEFTGFNTGTAVCLESITPGKWALKWVIA